MSLEKSPIDVLIITAVKDELDVVREVESDWQRREDSSGYLYYMRRDKRDAGHALSMALASPIDMGGDFASNLATRPTNELRPKCLAMVGICAGWRGKVFLGDVIVADRVFRYDAGKLRAYQAGEGRVTDVFHDIRTYNLKPQWVQFAQDFGGDWINTIRAKRPLTQEYQTLWLLDSLDAFESGMGEEPVRREDRKTKCPDWATVLQKLKDEALIRLSPREHIIRLTNAGKAFLGEYRIVNPDGIKPDPDKPRVHVAPMGTGNRVVEDPDLFPTIALYERKVLGVEMEGSAVGVVAAVENVDHCIIAKSVTDYADLQKNDHFRHYAIEASYRFLVAFLKAHLPPTRAKTADDREHVHLDLLRAVHLRLGSVRDWVNLHQQCQAINLNLVVLLGVMTANDLQSALTDLQNI